MPTYYCRDEHIKSEVHLVGGPLDGQVREIHVCGHPSPAVHNHLDNQHAPLWVGCELNRRGFWDHEVALYTVACGAVDNFVTLVYTSTALYEHGHPRSKRCVCFELAVE